MKECALLTSGCNYSDESLKSPMNRNIALYLYGVQIEIPPDAKAADIRAAARVLDRLADEGDGPLETGA